MKEGAPKEWYWIFYLVIFFFEREFIMDMAFALIKIIWSIAQ